MTTTTATPEAGGHGNDADAMMARFNELEGGSAAVEQGEDAQTTLDEVDAGVEDGEQSAQGEDEQEADEADQEPEDDKAKDEPPQKRGKSDAEKRLAKMDKHVGKLVKAKRELRAQLETRGAEVEKARAAVSLLQERVEHYRSLLAQAGLLDDKDEQIAEAHLSRRAREVAEKADVASKQRALQAEADETREEARERLSMELEDALERHELADRSAVIAKARENPGMSLMQAAAAVERSVLAKARTRLGVVTPTTQDVDDGVDDPTPTAAPQRKRPPYPAGVRTRPGGTPRKVHPPTEAGMLARFEELQAVRK